METEKERAAFYQQHKDDPDVWGDSEPVTPVEEKKGLSISITVRFPADEAALIRRTAEALGVTYSELVRKAVGQFVRPTHGFEMTQASPNRFFDYGRERTGTGSAAQMQFADFRPTVTGLASAKPR